MTAVQKVVLYDPAVSSLNMGDHVISRGARDHLSPLLRDAFVVDVSTHLPVSSYLRFLKDADLRFVLGSNLLRGKMNRPFRQWDLNPVVAPRVGPAILVGVGWWQYGDDPNQYTKRLYRRVLHGAMLHSVRDQYTANRLADVGFDNVCVTACPSMWSLTPELCASLPRQQASRVVSTLTDYHPDPQRDTAMLRTLLARYDEVYVWLQGYGDSAYVTSLGLTERIRFVAPALEAYDALLDEGDIDYVGTRLHGGIRALQRGRRSLIIGIDNRAKEKQRDFGLPVLDRHDIDALPSYLDEFPAVDLRLPWAAIEQWKGQFPGLVAESTSAGPGLS